MAPLEGVADRAPRRCSPAAARPTALAGRPAPESRALVAAWRRLSRASAESGDRDITSVATLPDDAMNRCRFGSLDAHGLKRRRREAHHAAGLVDLAGRVPAADREHARRRQALQEDLPGLDRVEAVLRQREGAGARGGPGVDQAHLDDVEGALGTGKPASRLVDLEGDARQPAMAV